MAAALIRILLSVAAVTVLAAANGAVLSPEDPEVLKAANFAISTYNQFNNNNPYAYKLLSVESATAQIYPPARVKYSLWVSVGQTVCKNRPDISLTQCALQNTHTMTCRFVVLAVPNSALPSYLLMDRCQ
ncbi:hypothetical protein COCON_G00039660 [Conger conger]|uniref:Cystatin domain-containing protein n=1 Tax=Conger conger TaxID=82655 RepID=A0A9Q1E0A7_CONCO|nr:hypothetical protein COCON_G00039660 [Conger conger]